MTDNEACEICGQPATTAYRDSRAGKLQRGTPDVDGKTTLWESRVPCQLHLRCDEHPGEAVTLPASQEDSDFNIALCKELGIELVPVAAEVAVG